MNKFIFEIILKIRAYTNRLIKPVSSASVALSRLQPVSRKFGFDRGTPIDRYWIEKFLQKFSGDVKGTCLEIGDNRYTKLFGKGSVTKSIILDINPKNKKATVLDDIRSLKKVKSNSVDCIILTQVLGAVDDCHSAVKSCYRILKPGGIILATSSCLSPTYEENNNFWRFTKAGFTYLFTRSFPQKHVEISTYGNVWAGQCFWTGMAQEDVGQEVLDFQDPNFPCLVAIRAIKPYA